MRMVVLGKRAPEAWLSLSLDQSAYTAGDTVRGRVTLTVSQDLLADELVVRVRGQELISWVEEVTARSKNGGSHTKRKAHSRKNVFLIDRLRLFAFPRAFAKGEQYAFPFAYQTHASLPGVFTLDQQAHGHRSSSKVRDLRASISYSVRATLDQGYLFDCFNSHARCDLVLHGLPKLGPQYQVSTSAGTYDATSQCVRLLSLLDQGKCEVAASLDKSVYVSGETARLQYYVKNASRVDIRALKVTLYYDVYLQLDRHEREPVSTCMASFEFPGVPSESETNDSVAIVLVCSRDGRQLAPPTNGSLISCGYRVHLQCDIPWSPDVTLNLPILITPPAAPALGPAGAIPIAVPVPTAIPVEASTFALRDAQSEREAAIASGIH